MNSYARTKNAYNNFTNTNQAFYKKLKTKALLNKNKEKDKDFHEKLSSTMNNFRKNNYQNLGYNSTSNNSYAMKKKQLKNEKNNNNGNNNQMRNSNSASKRRSMGNCMLDRSHNSIHFTHKKNKLSITTKPKNNDSDEIRKTITFNDSKIIAQKLGNKDSFIDITTIEDTYKEIRDQQRMNLTQLKKEKKLSTKECAYYILATSPILRLTERLIFSGSTKAMRNAIPKIVVLKNHINHLKSKVTELQNEIILCNNTISTTFIATKIADITLNFITSNDEQEFKEFDMINSEDSNSLTLYYNFIKILYYLLGEHIDNELNDNKKLKNELFEKLKLKGYLYIKDYLYANFIEQKDIGISLENLDEVNKIIKKYPELLEFHERNRICRFVCFTAYLIKEIINYANNIRDTMELKNKAQNFLEIVVQIYDRFQSKNRNILE